MEAKKNGDLRPCGDYGAFNQILVENRLLIQDFYLQLHCKRLSSVSILFEHTIRRKTLRRRVWSGLFVFATQLSYASVPLKNCFEGLDNIFVYIDDALVVSSNPGVHTRQAERNHRRPKEMQPCKDHSQFSIPSHWRTRYSTSAGEVRIYFALLRSIINQNPNASLARWIISAGLPYLYSSSAPSHRPP